MPPEAIAALIWVGFVALYALTVALYAQSRIDRIEKRDDARQSR